MTADTRRTGSSPAFRPATDQDGVRLPRLRLKDVLVRGAAHGIAAIVLLAATMLFVTDHHDRETFLAVVAGFSAVSAGTGIVFGAFFWAVCSGDIRRWRDRRTLVGQTDAVTIMAPALVRTGVLALVLFPGAWGLYHLVDDAAYGDWLYGS